MRNKTFTSLLLTSLLSSFLFPLLSSSLTLFFFFLQPNERKDTEPPLNSRVHLCACVSACVQPVFRYKPLSICLWHLSWLLSLIPSCVFRSALSLFHCLPFFLYLPSSILYFSLPFLHVPLPSSYTLRLLLLHDLFKLFNYERRRESSLEFA